MSHLKIDVSRYGGKRTTIPYKCFTFSGGEEHIRLDLTDQPVTGVRMIMLNARLVNSSNVMLLAMATDALRQHFGESVHLELNCPYFPYARQDRVCYPGEAVGVKVMADIINEMCFNQVYITDPHSDQVEEWLHRCIAMPQDMLFVLHGIPDLRDINLIVSPDEGATKKAKAVQECLKVPNLIQAEKVRDTDTGHIVATTVVGDVAGKNILIPDDICDGGRTFIELAKILKEMGAAKITLFVTHGIFSNGVNVFNGLIDEIITTNSFRTKSEYQRNNLTAANLTVMELEGL